MNETQRKNLINRIKQYKYIEIDIINLENKINEEKNNLEILESMIESCTSNTNSYNFGGSDFNSYERKMDKYISEKEEIKNKIKKLNKEISLKEKEYGLITKALEILSKKELIVIEENILKGNSLKYISKNIFFYSYRHIKRIKITALENLSKILK